MMRRSIVITFCILALSPAAWAAVDDQPLPPLVIAQTTTAPQSGDTPAPLPVPVPAPAPPATGTEPQGEDLTQPDPNQTDGAADDGSSPDELSLGEIPVIETMELTADIARRALDCLHIARAKSR